MLEFIKSQNPTPTGFYHISQAGCEVTQFMRNFFEAVQGGNYEEISTYYSDEMINFNFPLSAKVNDESIVVDDHLATFRCSFSAPEYEGQELKFVLDKSEGYWQIIHGELNYKNVVQ
jgi:hypothetical protein